MFVLNHSGIQKLFRIFGVPIIFFIVYSLNSSATQENLFIKTITKSLKIGEH